MGSKTSKKERLEHGGASSLKRALEKKLTRKQMKWWLSVHPYNNEMKLKLLEECNPKDERYMRNDVPPPLFARWAAISEKQALNFERKYKKAVEECWLMDEEKTQQWVDATGDLVFVDRQFEKGWAPTQDVKKLWKETRSIATLMYCFKKGIVPDGYEEVLPDDDVEVWTMARYWWPDEVLEGRTGVEDAIGRVLSIRSRGIVERVEFLVSECPTDVRKNTFIVQLCNTYERNGKELLQLISRWEPPCA